MTFLDHQNKKEWQKQNKKSSVLSFEFFQRSRYLYRIQIKSISCSPVKGFVIFFIIIIIISYRNKKIAFAIINVSSSLLLILHQIDRTDLHMHTAVSHVRKVFPRFIKAKLSKHREVRKIRFGIDKKKFYFRLKYEKKQGNSYP